MKTVFILNLVDFDKNENVYPDVLFFIKDGDYSDLNNTVINLSENEDKVKKLWGLIYTECNFLKYVPTKLLTENNVKIVWCGIIDKFLGKYLYN